jgi:deoxyhypusine synthase
MPSRFEELSLHGVRTLSIHDRKSKVAVEEFGAEPRAGMTVRALLDTFPQILAGRDLRILLDRMEKTLRARREWIVMLGGHVVKTGMAPVFRPAIDAGWITCVSMNGSAAIHDVEIALYGRTSEIVEENLADGSFGMVRETSDFVNEAARRAQAEGEGFGERLGRDLLAASPPYARQSFLAACAERGIPATVHVALGTDIVHQHPTARGDAIGDATLRDFRVLAARVACLQEGAVWNVGSAVLMPEVFLKALTVARNLGNEVGSFSAVNFDMIRQYRPMVNVVERPTRETGWGTHLAGQHEILIPLVVAALLDRMT